jgi:PAS domain S-box-containing protein
MSTMQHTSHHGVPLIAGLPDSEMLSALIQHLPACVFVKDLSGNYVMVNQSMAEMLGGKTIEDIIGKNDEAFLSPEKARCNRLDEQRIIATGLPLPEKTEFIQTSRLSAWYSITKAPVRDAANAVTGIIGVARDISDHLLSEQRERATSQDLKAVVEIADRLITSTDLDSLLRKAVELARSHLRVERCSILINHGDHLRGTFGTDLKGHTTDERDKIIPMDPAWENRFRMWNQKSSQWIVERDIHRSSPDARAASVRDFWVATTPIKGSHNKMIGVFCNDSVITGSRPDERLQDVVAVFCSLLGNIIERQRGMDEIQSRDQVLEGVARSASQLLTVDSIDPAINESLRVLGESMQVDRVYIFKNHTDAHTGEWMMSQKYEWVAETSLASLSDRQLQNLPYQPIFSDMYESLANGRIVDGPVDRFTTAQREFLQDQKIISILIVPIHLNNKFWGFIGFDDCRRPREWSANEKTILLAMAGNLGGAISKELTERELKSRDRILSRVAQANHELLTNPDVQQAAANALQILAPAVNAERIFLLENQLDSVTGPVMHMRFMYDKLTASKIFYPEHERDLSYSEHFPGWFSFMSTGKSIHGRMLDFITFEPNNVRSILLAPLMIEKKFWGIIGFDTSDYGYSWSESDVSTLATIAGSVSGAIARNRAEESLRGSEEHFRSLIESASDLILVADQRGSALYGSPSVERKLGIPASQLVNVNLLELIHPDDQTTLRAVFKGLGTNPDQSQLIELRVRDHQGNWLNMECAVKFVPDQAGQTRYIINSRDITERTKAEVALHRSEELLRHSQKMEAVGRLAGGVAHDFNNLLTAILGYGDLLLEQIPTDQVWRRELEEIYRAAERAHSLTRQLLAFSRRQVMESKQVDLNLIVVEMERLLKRLISENVILITSIDPAPCTVKVDRGQIEQVIINLALNSRDAMKDGGELKISTEKRRVNWPIIQGMVTVPTGNYIVLKISDTGHGISDEIKPHIFEPFFTTKEFGKGTGLGLSMVLGIVEQSAGFILFDSKVGTGSEFSIYLPHVEQTEIVRRDEVPQSMAGGSETVLLLEDDQIVRELSTRILTEKGYQVITRENGEVGLEYFRQNASSIDLVLTDIIMPQMSGLSFARAARQIRPDLRILFISGYAEDHQPESHETGNGRNYIQKPFTVATLCSRIREILDSPAEAVKTT